MEVTVGRRRTGFAGGKVADGAADAGDGRRIGHERRHRVDEVAERTEPDAMPVDDALDVRTRRQLPDFHDAHGALHANVIHVRKRTARRELFGEFALDTLHLRAVVAFGEELERRDAGGAGKRVRHVRWPVHERAWTPGGNGIGHLPGGKRGGKRDVASGEGLPHAHHVGRDPRPLCRPERPRAVEAGGDLVDSNAFLFIAE